MHPKEEEFHGELWKDKERTNKISHYQEKKRVSLQGKLAKTRSLLQQQQKTEQNGVKASRVQLSCHGKVQRHTVIFKKRKTSLLIIDTEETTKR